MSRKYWPQNVRCGADVCRRRELCLLRIEVLHFRRGWQFEDNRKNDLQSIFTPVVKITSSYSKCARYRIHPKEIDLPAIFVWLFTPANLSTIIFDETVKSRKTPVLSFRTQSRAHAGWPEIQSFRYVLDTGFLRHDDYRTFDERIKFK